MSERKAMIKARQQISVTRQCQPLAVPRSSAYARPQRVSEVDVELMKQINKFYWKWPFYGSRRFRDELQYQGYRVNRKRVQHVRCSRWDFVLCIRGHAPAKREGVHDLSPSAKSPAKVTRGV